MPISTVASESTFSMSGRVIDDFRASLTPRFAQALICTQGWLRNEPPSEKPIEEDYGEIECIEEGIFILCSLIKPTGFPLESPSELFNINLNIVWLFLDIS